jgi:NAD(P)-dependent dehydrogenase (short-subunit alcohol dehydrogenase family)
VALNGRFRSAPFLEESPLSQEEIFSSNYFSVAHLLQRWIPHMVPTGGGTFITVSTMGVTNPYGGATSYIASKGALLALTRALDRELHADGIRGHCIVAGPMLDDEKPIVTGAVSYGTIVDAIRRLLRTRESGASYFPAIKREPDGP